MLLTAFPSRVSDELNSRDTSGYSLTVASPTVTLLEPIRAQWRAPAGHPAKDWIGLYRVDSDAAAASSDGAEASSSSSSSSLPARGGADTFTKTSSRGFWRYISADADGEAIFSGDRLPMAAGTYELRLHFDNSHVVVASVRIVVALPQDLAALAASLSGNGGNSNGNGGNNIVPARADVERRISEVAKTLFGSDADADANADAHVDSHVDIGSGTDLDVLARSLNEKVRERRVQSLLAFVRGVYGVELDGTVLASYPTAEALAEYLHNSLVTLHAAGGWRRESGEDAKKER